MSVAVSKYFKFTRVAYEEEKDIADTKLPSIFICPKQHQILGSLDILEKHGYRSFSDFLLGSINESQTFVSWEGMQNITYSNMTNLVFDMISIGDLYIKGFPEKNKNIRIKDKMEVFMAFDGSCRKLDINASDITKDDIYTILIIYSPRFFFQMVAKTHTTRLTQSP